MEQPKFAGDATPTYPPFQFSNVMISVFPLRAKLGTLQRFVDSLLNIIPPELGYFRVPLPYVSLMLLDYGKLAAQASNYGWFAQREIMISVPLEWYKWVDGRWLFHSWASCSPFMYIDSQMSLQLGRTAMGWPKSLVELAPELTGWLKDPGGNTVDLSLRARLFDHDYAGSRSDLRTLLTVSSPMPASMQYPLAVDSPYMPWNVWSDTARTMTSLATDYMSALAGLGVWPPHVGSTGENALRKLQGLGGTLSQSWPWALRSEILSVNLKQFRLADEPRKFCYQALTNGPMRYTAFHRAGLLGATPFDPSGGYRIDIGRYASFPVVDLLGLESTIAPSMTDDEEVARLSPFMPYWYEVDMEYQSTDTLAWRAYQEPKTGREGVWTDQQGKHYPDARPDLPPYFNTTADAAAPVLTGPFIFLSSTVSVYPFLVKKDVAANLIEETLNKPLKSLPEGHKNVFELWAGTGDYAYAYLIVTDAGQVSSETNAMGDWGDLSLTFYLPIRRKVNNRIVDRGLFPAFTFASGSMQACTFGELYGFPSVEAEFHKPARAWHGSEFRHGDNNAQLAVIAETLPAVNEGAGARACTLLEIWDRSQTKIAELGSLGADFVRLLCAEMKRKQGIDSVKRSVGRRRALRMLVDSAPLNVYTFKQFRDSGDPEKACYQALVQVPFRITDVHNLEEISERTAIDLWLRASFRIQEKLGLVPRTIALKDGAVVHRIEAVRPFRLRAALRLENGRELYTRATTTWQVHAEAEAADKVCSSEVDEWIPRRDAEKLARVQRENLTGAVRKWLVDHTDRAPVDALADDLDPQTVIEGILSREWLNRSAGARSQQLREDLKLHLGTVARRHADRLTLLLRRVSSDTRGSRVDRLLLWLRYVAALAALAQLQTSEEKVEATAAMPSGQALLPPGWSDADERWLGHARPLEQSALRRSLKCLPYREATDGLAGAAELAQLFEQLVMVFDSGPEDWRAVLVDAGLKPDHCILRESAGPERDVLLPLAESYDSVWYGKWDR